MTNSEGHLAGKLATRQEEQAASTEKDLAVTGAGLMRGAGPTWRN